MTTAVAEAPGRTTVRAEGPADALVVFGITGDLAKVMTFRSLYRLEKRGLLTCPVIGVAVNDWGIDQLRDHARESIEGTGERLNRAVFDRFARRLSYIQGDFSDSATYARVANAVRDRARPVFYLEDSSLPVREGRPGVGRSRADPYRPHRRGEAVRPRPGLGPCPCRRAPHLCRRVTALPHRSLPGEDGHRGLPSPVRERDAGANLAPQSSPPAGHHGQGVRGRGSRQVLRSCGRTPPTDVVVNHPCNSSPPRRWSPLGPDATLLRTVRLRSSARSTRPRQRTTSGANTGDTARHRALRRVPRRDVRARFLRLNIENWRWAGVPFYLRAASTWRPRKPRCGSASSTRHDWASACTGTGNRSRTSSL